MSGPFPRWWIDGAAGVLRRAREIDSDYGGGWFDLDRVDAAGVMVDGVQEVLDQATDLRIDHIEVDVPALSEALVDLRRDCRRLLVAARGYL